VSGEKVTTRPRIRLVKETEAGKHFGLVGVGGVTALDDEDSALEKIRLELLEVLTAGNEEAAEEENEQEYLRAYAESGMKPADFVEGIVEPYAEFLTTREEGQA
jgi:hypothetical protein